jgi:hypothetical protein
VLLERDATPVEGLTLRRQEYVALGHVGQRVMMFRHPYCRLFQPRQFSRSGSGPTYLTFAYSRSTTAQREPHEMRRADGVREGPVFFTFAGLGESTSGTNRRVYPVEKMLGSQSRGPNKSLFPRRQRT